MKILLPLLLSALAVSGQERQTASSQTEPDAEQPRTRQRTSESARSQASTNPPVAATVDETPVVTHHDMYLNGQTLNYTATAAQMPIMNASGETEAHIFYMAYTLDDATNA